tara:strand:- start:95 stop:430 length:336 start_codon:yes stop_codon:yes gene_type:complete
MSGELRLPKAFLMADLIYFEPRRYEYYEDDEGYDQRDIANYETYTRKADVCRMAVDRNKPVYYFRRHISSAMEDKNSFNASFKDRFKITARMFRRRVIVMPQKTAEELYDE